MIIYNALDTILGEAWIACSDTGICLLEFADRYSEASQIKRLSKLFKREVIKGHHPLINEAQQQLEHYFSGHRKVFDLPLDLAGTDFQRRVWAALTAIPYGVTRSYLEQARTVSNDKAVRAVAKANGDNPVSIIVPCHRVIGSDCSLTGYGGGLWRKKRLLELEGSISVQASLFDQDPA
ncbi:methylated-DNA--[protein]-cysteine S-methyltransferase [Gynuella sunshinyii]|uniref:Methylated-DNA--protein-cysteine methyltransferase n=1 Tax=Gynuella sunshinyii YC6258 TaxID=1445510 RepID=A0A0C5UYB8_9GAMM|nr:methylated-DNA--[protein]-cysteine S-methyltransferase [Gynuella sunshinyii]AJQ92255.1 methylated DNA-protein cysteine methyltransferase [Gynuella sunshinyii YC6258]